MRIRRTGRVGGRQINTTNRPKILRKACGKPVTECGQPKFRDSHAPSMKC
ncbi:hypothetical protein BH11PSE4_BH11PSE4_05210 [soil metagenome]